MASRQLRLLARQLARPASTAPPSAESLLTFHTGAPPSAALPPIPAHPTATEDWRAASRISTASNAAGDRTEQVVLEEGVPAGELVLRVHLHSGCLVDEPAWDVLQVGASTWARFGGRALKLNHAGGALANTRLDVHLDDGLLRRVDVVSSRPIEAGTALSFNYNTTEWSMAEPFHCWETDADVQGFAHEPAEEQRRLLDGGLVAPHIRALWEEEEGDTQRRRL